VFVLFLALRTAAAAVQSQVKVLSTPMHSMTALHYSRALLLPNVHVLASAILLLLLHSRPPHNLRPANVRVIMCRIKYACIKRSHSHMHLTYIENSIVRLDLLHTI
jgi:hypothetical protein